MNRDVFCRSCLVTDVELCSMNKLNLLEPYETLTGIKVMQSKDLSVFMCGCCKTLLLKCIWFVNKCKKAEEVLEIAEKQYNVEYWINFKSRVRGKISTINAARRKTGGGREVLPELQPLEQRVVGLIGSDFGPLPGVSASSVPVIPVKAKFVKTIDRTGLKLGLPLTSSLQELINIPEDVDIKEELPFEDYFNQDFFSNDDTQDFKNEALKPSSDLSDEEVLSDLAKKKSLKRVMTVKKKVGKRKRVKKAVVKKDCTVKKEVSVKKDSDDLWTEDFNTTTSKTDNDPVLLDKWDATFKILTKDEAVEELQSRENSLNYIRCLYKCDKCYKGFQTEATLNNHLVLHDPRSGHLECDVCFQRYPSKVRLRCHTKKAHLYRYICNQCGTASKTVCRAKQHYKWHLGFTYNCKICEASFKKLTTYFTHLRIVHPSGKFKCELCDIFFISNKGLHRHNRMRHAVNSSVSPSCDKCNVKFKNENALKLHQQNMVNGECDSSVKPCSLCGVTLLSDEELSEHIKQNHPKSKCFKCPICKKMLSTHKTLGQHYESMHLGIKRGVRDSAPAGLGTIICEVCGKICSNKHVYTCHQRQHTGEKPYQCSLCPMKFCQVQNLQNHIRTHTGERPYKCNQCDKTFRSKACINRHSRVHTGAKPYSCPHCGKTFTQTNSVKLHINTVHFKMPQPYRNRRKHQT